MPGLPLRVAGLLLAGALLATPALALPPHATLSVVNTVLAPVLGGALALGALVWQLLRWRLVGRHSWVLWGLMALGLAAVGWNATWLTDRHARWETYSELGENLTSGQLQLSRSSALIAPWARAELIGTGQPVLVVDLRDTRHWLARRLPGSVNLDLSIFQERNPVFGDDGYTQFKPEVRPLYLAELERRWRATTPRPDAMVLVDYNGFHARDLAEDLSAKGIPTWAVLGGDNALHFTWDEFTRPGEGPDEALHYPTVPESVARRWGAAGVAQFVAVDRQRVEGWLRDDQARRAALDKEVAPLTVVVHGGGADVHAANLVRHWLAEAGKPPPALVDTSQDEPPGPVAALQGLGFSVEQALGLAWWLPLLLVGLAVRVGVGLRQRRAFLRGRPSRLLGALDLGVAVLLLLVAEAMAGGVTTAGVPTTGPSALHQLAALAAGLGALLQLAEPDTVLAARRRLALRRALGGVSEGEEAPAPTWPAGLRWLPVAALIGVAALWSAPAVAGLLAGLAVVPALVARVPGGQPQGERLWALAGVPRSAPGDPLRVQTRAPGAPGRALVQRGGDAWRVGLLGRDLGGLPPELSATVQDCVAAAAALGRDLDVELGAARTVSMPPPATGADARVHAQLLAVRDAAQQAGLDAAALALDGQRYAEAAPEPTPLTLSLFARRAGPRGGARRAAALLALPFRPTRVLRVGRRVYELPPPAGSTGLLRWTAPMLLKAGGARWRNRELPRLLDLGAALEGAEGRLLARRVAALGEEGATWAEAVALAQAATGAQEAALLALHEPAAPYELAAPSSIPPLPVAGLGLRTAVRIVLAGLHRQAGARLRAVHGDAVFGASLDDLAAGHAPSWTDAWADLQAMGPLPAQLDAAQLEDLGVDGIAPDRALPGLALGAGLPVEGPVRRGPAGPGEIAVRARLDPAEVVALAAAGVAGVVVEVGGRLSHAAILLREAGLPALVGVDGATQLLHEGQRVRLSTDGRVEPLDGASPATDGLVALERALDPARVGGKAAALARLLGAGLPVPDGVVLPVGQLADPRARAALARWAEGRGALIVRSSAVVEDGARRSLAGLLRSEGPLSHHQLEAAVARCAEAGRAVVGDGLALLVQEHRAGRLGGVMFTRAGADAPARATVEVSEDGAVGAVTGEGVVASFQLDWPAGEVRDAQGKPVDAALVAALARTAATVEAAAGGPRDVEWVWTGQQLYVVQARPITVGLQG